MNSGYKKNNNQTRGPMEGLEMGKIPPQAIDLEEAVLGAVMLEKTAFSEVDGILTEESFYKEAHQKIFLACRQLSAKNEPIDLTTVVNQLKKNGDLEESGGAYYVAWLTNRVGSAAHIEYHSRVIAEKFMLREAIRFASETISKAFDDTTDPFDVIDYAEANFKSLQGSSSGSLKHVSIPMGEVTQNYWAAKNNEWVTGAILTGISGYDSIQGRMLPGKLYVIGGRPAMGKTLTMLEMCRRLSVRGHRGLIFSLEMTSLELVSRMVCAQAMVDYDDMIKGKLSSLEEMRYVEAETIIKGWPLHIEDMVTDINRIRSIARKFKSKNPDLSYVMLDYLQMCKGKNPDGNFGTRDEQVSFYAHMCKSISKECHLPFIALAQANREVEKRGNTLEAKKPQMGDLRESGGIEAAADSIMFPFRPSYYKECLSEEEKIEWADDIWWIFRKNRGGKIGEAADRCKLNIQRIFCEGESAPVPNGGAEFDDFTTSSKNFYEVAKPEDENGNPF